MNKSAVKNFAVRARNKLIEDVTQKMYELGITNKEIKEIETFEGGFRIQGLNNSKIYKKYEVKQREKLISKIKEKGYEQIVEEVVYTWFNRFIALRFMEVNDYLPSGVRVLSSKEGKRDPDIIREALNIDFDLNLKEYNEHIEIINRLMDANDTEDLFRYLLIKQCNQLGKIMPMAFEEISDYTELLLPDNLLVENSIISVLVASVDEDDYKDQVEIIGWMYQYYISEKKDEVFAELKKNVKLNKDTIPAATQLFTPQWVVKYMVENSLGRLWLTHCPSGMACGNSEDALRELWTYYIDEAEQASEVEISLNDFTKQFKFEDPTQIKVIDPCMGSGHILVYAFDVLYQIYLSQGYSERDIPNLILQSNLYGLDIDDRAGQLSYFALMIKARSYNRRFFRQDIIPQPTVYAIPEINISNFDLEKWFGVNMAENKRKVAFADLEYLVELFSKGKEYGSAMKIEREIDFNNLREYIHDFAIKQISIDDTDFMTQVEDFDRIVDVAEILAAKYDVVVTNPPYMGGNGMSSLLAEFVKKYYPYSKSDMSTVFMEKTLELCNPHGYMAMINIPVWMFLSSYEKLREQLLLNRTFINLLHMGRGIFGADFGTTAFVIKASYQAKYVGTYRKLYSRQGAVDNMEKKLDFFFSDYGKYLICQDNFFAVPSFTIAYSASTELLNAFKDGKRIDTFADPKQGLATADNSRFLRFWQEVDFNKCGFLMSQDEAKKSRAKWFPYNKGGGFKKWYGNNEYVINWENDGLELRNFKGSVIRSPQYYFRECLTWCKVTISGFSMRYIPEGFLFDVAGCSLFSTRERMNYVLAFANSKVNAYILSIISPTVNYEVGHVASLPIVGTTNERIEALVTQNITISRTDWDSFETSWDFKRHPLIKFKQSNALWGEPTDEDFRNNGSIYLSYKAWETFKELQFFQLKSNEEELNRIFIDIYGLQDELTPEVEDKDITIRKADREREIKSFISYAVGCMFGRYSLDEEGLIYAGGEFDINRYKKFIPTTDNVLVIADDDYFEEDIVNRFVEFVKITFGEEPLEKNLDYIAETLGVKTGETSRQAIRRCFLKDFYKDHVKIYQKRPIYWQFDSGRQNGFKALIYMHRYDSSTAAGVRVDYLHKLQKKYEAEAGRLNKMLESDLPARDAAAAKKKRDKINKQIQECLEYDQVIAHVANLKINIDLDDGVAVNYEKFQNVEVPQGEGKRPLKLDLLAKI